jgi:hypothetical protein
MEAVSIPNHRTRRAMPCLRWKFINVPRDFAQASHIMCLSLCSSFIQMCPRDFAQDSYRCAPGTLLKFIQMCPETLLKLHTDVPQRLLKLHIDVSHGGQLLLFINTWDQFLRPTRKRVNYIPTWSTVLTHCNWCREEDANQQGATLIPEHLYFPTQWPKGALANVSSNQPCGFTALPTYRQTHRHIHTHIPTHNSVFKPLPSSKYPGSINN